MTTTDRRTWTTEDVADRGAAAVLAELREAFAAEHAAYPQYAGAEAVRQLGIVRRRVGGFQTFVRAEVGEVVLVRPIDPAPWASFSPITNTAAWMPRVGWDVSCYAGEGDWCEVQLVPVTG